MYIGTRIIKDLYILKSFDEIRASMQEAVMDYLDTCREMGMEIPEEFSGEYQLQLVRFAL